MTRKALIIGSPDAQIPGVYADMRNYRDFFKSPSGGGWYEHEITTLENPSASAVRECVRALQIADYSVVIFAGHGYYSAARRCTMVQLQSNIEMEEHELKIGAKKHTLIIDACRVVVDDRVLKKAMESVAILSARTSTNSSRQVFDSAIARCAPGLATMYSCALNETAGDIKDVGGRYSSSLLQVSSEWADASGVGVLSVSDAQERAIPLVQKQSGGRQNPTHDFPRTVPRFPFAVKA